MTTIVMQLAECEEMIARIYAAYAKRLPELTDFWSGLSRDELEHARLVRFLADGITTGTVSFNLSDIRPQSIQMFYSYLHSQAVRAESELMAPIATLSIALNIEKSILEADYFRQFKGSSIMAASALRQLQEDTRRHRDELQKKWEEHRRYS